MGFHDICRNPFHYFDKTKDFGIYELPNGNGENEYVYWGICAVCEKQRIVF